MVKMSANLALGIAWLLALIASLAVLLIGEVLGQTPCVLCWFQRSFMFPLTIILGFGLWWHDSSVSRYGILLASFGAAIASWHMAIYTGMIPQDIQPCDSVGVSCKGENQDFLGVPIPLMSLITFLAINSLLAISLKKKCS